jgi:site-specific recombinase XerD
LQCNENRDNRTTGSRLKTGLWTQNGHIDPSPEARFMVEKDFSVYPRRRSGSNPVWYYRVKKHNKQWSSGRSTGIEVEYTRSGKPKRENRDRAEQWVRDHIATDDLSLPGSRRHTFGELADGFWDADGYYVLSRREFDHNLTESHRYNRERISRTHLIPEWSNWRLEEITAPEVKRWLLSYKRNGYLRTLKDDSTQRVHLSTATMNDIRETFSQMLEFAVAEGLIRVNPVRAVPRFRGESESRGVLTMDELYAILDSSRVEELWPKESYWLATFTAAGTGLRLGEIRTLTSGCIGENYIRVERGIDEKTGQVKLPKWNKVRTTPAPRKVTSALHDYIARNGFRSEDWVFPGRPQWKDGGWRYEPVSGAPIRRAFYGALAGIGIDQTERKRRRVTFHSLRHSVILAARKARVDQWQLMKAVGHNDLKMLDEYSDHEVEAAELDAVVAFQSRYFAEDSTGSGNQGD